MMHFVLLIYQILTLECWAQWIISIYLTSEINDQVQRSLIVRQVCEDKTVRVVEHNYCNTQQLKDKKKKKKERKVIMALTVHGYENISQREVHAVREKLKKTKKQPSPGFSMSLSYNTVSEDADLSVSAKFTVFPFPFLVLFSNLLQNHCHWCQLSVCFGDAPIASKSVSQKNGKSITKEDKA